MKITIGNFTYLLLMCLFTGCSLIPSVPNQSPNSNLQSTREPILTKEIPSTPENQEGTQVNLPNLGQAPEINNEVWLNVDQPLRLSDLRGKVVLLEMWTFGCINCQHVIPSLREWYAKYRDEGFIIIGNHFPEFSYEKDLDNLKDAIDRYDIEYAVAQDNDGQTWRAYNNHYWPALYLIDKHGNIRYTHIGEGAYTETEQAIQALLAEQYNEN